MQDRLDRLTLSFRDVEDLLAERASALQLLQLAFNSKSSF
jgi:hypothetical protein